MAFALRTPEERLTQLNKKQLQAIRKVYKNAYNNMSDRIERLNKDTFSGKVMESEFKKLKKELNEAYKEVGEQIKALTKSGATESADIAVQLANEFAEKIGVSVEGAYSYVPKEVVQSIVTGELYKGDWSLSKAIWGDLKQTQQDLQNIIAEGIAQNLPSPDIARAIQEYMNPDEKKGYDWLKEHPGTKTSIDYNAFRLSKTMISHAYQQAYEKTVEKNPFVEGIKWEVSNKHNVCDLCKKRAEQNDYGLGKGVYPKGKVPLDHPNGQCVLISVTPPLSEAADRLVAWRNGKNDPAMDKWYESMGLKKSVIEKGEEPKDKKILSKIVNGNPEAANTWVRRKSKFDFEIEDVINYQGFDGLPRVVDEAEFDKIVKESKFIAQRTYSAKTKKVLEAYRDQLYNGKWYVDCSTGGAQYGQGMYCAADWTGELTEGIKSEMRGYQELNKERGNKLSFVETLTLDPSAKTIKYEDLYNMKRYEYKEHMRKRVEEYSKGKDEGCAAFLRTQIGDIKDGDFEAAADWHKRDPKGYKKAEDLMKEINTEIEEIIERNDSMDDGTYAVLKGYDAINAEGHGDSGSYTVILNRTKLVIKRATTK